MERLSFSQTYRYDGLEAAIHLARYAFVKRLCAGRTVLDLACGEGYGSRQLLAWGASKVVGVDVSEEAIAAAKRNFSEPGVEFFASDAEQFRHQFKSQTFDLIVSLETIEHVPQPAQLLEDFKAMLAPGGTLVVSCPNDWWYYPSESERNPYHLRKYRYEEFKQFAEGILGQARAWYLGGPQAGFVNTRMGALKEAVASSDQGLMMEAVAVDGALLLPAEHQLGPRSEASAYFIGVWGELPRGLELGDQEGGASVPSSMDAFKDGFFRQTKIAAVDASAAGSQAPTTPAEVEGFPTDERHAQALLRLEKRIDQLRQELQEPASASEDRTPAALQQELRRVRLREAACEIEKAILQERMNAAQELAASSGRRARQSADRELLMRQKWQTAVAALGSTEAELSDSRKAIEQLIESEKRTRDAMDELRTTHGILVFEAARYRRIRDALPSDLRKVGVRVFRAARQMVKR